jgi:hypothetical protein
MERMMTIPNREQLVTVHQILLDYLIDKGRLVTAPQISADQLDTLTIYLNYLLVDSRAGLLPHIRFISRVNNCKFTPPLSRRLINSGGVKPVVSKEEGIHQLLLETKALSIVEHGLSAFDNLAVFPESKMVAIAELLLNPVALWDLADLIGYLLPDAWMPYFEEYGNRLKEQAKIVSKKPVIPELVGAFDSEPSTIQVRFEGPHGAVAEQRIAEKALGDSRAKFSIRIHTRHDGRAEVEMTPPPQSTDLTITTCFSNGELRMFTVPVVRIPSSIPGRVGRSQLCEPLPAGTFPLHDAVCEHFDNVDVVQCASLND